MWEFKQMNPTKFFLCIKGMKDELTMIKKDLK